MKMTTGLFQKRLDSRSSIFVVEYDKTQHEDL